MATHYDLLNSNATEPRIWKHIATIPLHANVKQTKDPIETGEQHPRYEYDQVRLARVQI